MILLSPGGSNRQGVSPPHRLIHLPCHASENPTVALRNGEIRPQILLTNPRKGPYRENLDLARGLKTGRHMARTISA
jgi:hypothetical protein